MRELHVDVHDGAFGQSVTIISSPSLTGVDSHELLHEFWSKSSIIDAFQKLLFGLLNRPLRVETDEVICILQRSEKCRVSVLSWVKFERIGLVQSVTLYLSVVH